MNEERVIQLLDRMERRLAGVLDRLASYVFDQWRGMRQDTDEHEERINRLENEVAAMLRREEQNGKVA